MAKMQTVSLGYIQKEMIPLYNAGVAMTLIGLPGVGKTEILKSTSHEILRNAFKGNVKEIALNAAKKDAVNEILTTASDTAYQFRLEGRIEDADKVLQDAHTLINNGEFEYKQKFTSDELAEALTRKAEESFFMIDGSGIPDEGLVMPWVDMAATDGQRLQRDLLVEFKDAKRWLLDEENAGKTLIFFVDEITSFTQDDQRTLMNFIQSGILPDGDQIDHERIFFVLAGNPSNDMPGYEDYDGATNPMETAVITRAATFFVEPNLGDFLAWGEKSSADGNSNIHPYIVASLKKDPGMYMREDESDIRVFNSRTGFKLSQYLYTASELGTGWNKSTVKAFIGDSVGDALSAIISNLDRLVGIQELFGSEKSKKLNKDALAKFKMLTDFEKYYVIASATDEASPLKFSKEANVAKFTQLLKEGDVPAETALAIGQRIVNAKSGTNAHQLMNMKWITTPETNIQEYLRSAKLISNMI